MEWCIKEEKIDRKLNYVNKEWTSHHTFFFLYTRIHE